MQVPHSFLIMAAAKSFVVSAGTAALKDSWMKDLKNVLQAIKDAAPAAGQAEVVRPHLSSRSLLLLLLPLLLFLVSRVPCFFLLFVLFVLCLCCLVICLVLANSSYVIDTHPPLLAQAPVWMPDTPDCTSCKQEFSFWLRKHHCRACGACVCDDCSKQTRLYVHTRMHTYMHEFLRVS